MKTAFFAFLLSCAAVALAQSPAEKPVNDYTNSFRSVPRYGNETVKAYDFVYEPSYKNIKPPLPSEDIDKDYFVVDAGASGTIKTPSGTTIRIPANAFVDEKGNPVEGNVTVSYREFKNPLDFILSGIPMSYDDKEGKNQFISAGMFEINASSGGKKVFLKPGSKVEMEFASMDAAPDYNLYAFNDSTGSWEVKTDKSNVGVNTVNRTPYIYSSAINRYYSFLRYSDNKMYDSTKLNERFENPKYFYTEYITEKEIKEHRWWYGGKSYRSLIKIGSVHKAKDGTITFKLTRTTGASSHSELAPYYHVSWKVAGSMGVKQFGKIAGNQNCFSDIRIEKDGDNYTIKLKGLNGFTEISAEPVKMNSDYKVKPLSEKVQEKMYKTYSKMLAWRTKKFDKDMINGRLGQNYVTVSKEEMPQYAWAIARPNMTNDEKKMTLEEWQNYLVQQQEAEKQAVNYSAANSSTITRSFAIDGMGVWNCDQIKRLDNPVTVLASYQNKNGKSFSASNTFIVNKKINGVLQYYNNEVSFSKTSDNILITIKDNGEIAYATAEEIKKGKYKNKSPYTFSLNESSGGSASVAELRKTLGL